MEEWDPMGKAVEEDKVFRRAGRSVWMEVARLGKQEIAKVKKGEGSKILLTDGSCHPTQGFGWAVVDL